jgi:hypothetical protein
MEQPLLRQPWLPLIAMTAGLALLAGCRVAMLNVEDIIVYSDAPGVAGDTSALSRLAGGSAAGESLDFDPGSRVQLRAYLEQRSVLSTVGWVSGVPVEFRSGGRLLGTAVSDKQGRAVLPCDSGSQHWQFSARANLPVGELTSQGTVYVWPADQPVIVIDLDETLLQSRYVSMILWLQDPSPPAEQARETVRRLSEHCGIIYLSTRARLFRNMTQEWLAGHDFPPGPIVHTDDISAVFDQRQAKYDMVAELQRRGIRIVAGIGDKSADELAFDDCGLLTIIVRPGYAPRRSATIVLADWMGVEAALGQHLPVEMPAIQASMPDKSHLAGR